MSVYYNEHDPFAATWLRELMKGGYLPDGEVDERDIQAVTPADVSGFTTCHFFAGIGGWALALQYADWPVDRPIWTGSCPCQPFSAAGKGAGATDPRHLWPHWFRLIKECRPHTVVGEQVANAIGHGWLDLVCADLEAEGYAIGAVVLGAHSVGAPHQRQRVWWVANAHRERRTGQHPLLQRAASRRDEEGVPEAAGGGELGDMADSASARRIESGRPSGSTLPAEIAEESGRHSAASCTVGLSDRLGEDSPRGLSGGAQLARLSSHPWADAEWIPCRDEKFRSVEPGTFPLAHGIPARVGRLRGYGNAIVPQVGAAFLRAYLEC